MRQLTDDAQVVTDEYSFDGWGKLTSSTGSTANSQLYKGEYLAYRKDPDAGPELQYSTHHRNYNPQTGVFTAADPAKDDLNLYRYVKNNPVNEVDPSGRQDERRCQLVAAHESAIAEFEAVKKELQIVPGKPTPRRTPEEWQRYSAAEGKVLTAFRNLNSYKSPAVPTVTNDSRSQRSRFNDALDLANAPSSQTAASYDENRRTRANLKAEVEKSQVGIDAASAAVDAPFDSVASAAREAQSTLSDITNDALEAAMQSGEAGTRWTDATIHELAREVPAHINSEMSQAADSAEILQNAGQNFSDLPDDPGRGYWSRVGGTFQGYWNSASKTGEALWQLGTSPIESAKGIAAFAKEAISHPGSTLKRFSEEVQEKSTTSEGRGEVVGDVLQAVFGPKLTGKAIETAKGAGWAQKAAGGMKSLWAKGRKLVEGTGNRKPKAVVPEVPPTVPVPERSPVGFQSQQISDARKALDDPELSKQAEFHQNPPKAQKVVAPRPLDRPASSPLYSNWLDVELQKGTHFPGKSDTVHFREANRQLWERMQSDSTFAHAIEAEHPGISDFLRPGPRGGIPDNTPASVGLTWHHSAQREGILELVPTRHHSAPGPVQNTLHPNQKGGMEIWGGGRQRRRTQ